MTRRADTIIYAISLLLLLGAASLWWRGIFLASDEELELVPDPEAQPWGDLETAGGDANEVSPGNDEVLPDDTEQDEQVIFVHIAGAVKSPGVYKLKPGQRLYEVLELAVPLEDADLDSLNLACVLYDQDKIYVPKKGEPAGNGGAVSGTSANLIQAGPAFPININTASAKELEALPGIGPAKALAIVEFRRQRGPFARKEDLLQVPGIGKATYDKIEALITVR